MTNPLYWVGCVRILLVCIMRNAKLCNDVFGHLYNIDSATTRNFQHSAIVYVYCIHVREISVVQQIDVCRTGSKTFLRRNLFNRNVCVR